MSHEITTVPLITAEDFDRIVRDDSLWRDQEDRLQACVDELAKSQQFISGCMLKGAGWGSAIAMGMCIGWIYAQMQQTDALAKETNYVN